VVLVLAIAYWVYISVKPASSLHDDLAQCLTKQGVVMYGTEWCPHCQDQKRDFGESFRYVTFINCDINQGACDAAGVEGYPTWSFPQGEPLFGEQELTVLAERAGCSVT